MSIYRISPHISYTEATKSRTAIHNGILNKPSDNQLANMMFASDKLFEPLRNWWGHPIGISSFFRSDKLNHLVGGSKTSQHLDGFAIDIDADIYNNGLTNKMIFDYFKNRMNIIDFDQLIYEFGNDKSPDWVHISKKYKDNRNDIFKSLRKNNKIIYQRV